MTRDTIVFEGVFAVIGKGTRDKNGIPIIKSGKRGGADLVDIKILTSSLCSEEVEYLKLV